MVLERMTRKILLEMSRSESESEFTGTGLYWS